MHTETVTDRAKIEHALRHANAMLQAAHANRAEADAAARKWQAEAQRLHAALAALSEREAG